MKLGSACAFVVTLGLGACIVTAPQPGPVPTPPGAIKAAPGAFAMLPAGSEEATIVVTDPSTVVLAQSGKVLFQSTFTTELPRTLQIPLRRFDDGSGAPRFVLAMQPGVALGAVVADDGQCIRCWDGDGQGRGTPPISSGPIDRPCCPPPKLVVCP